MTWNPLDEPADKVWVSQRWTPGLAEIDGANSPRNWEELPGYGWSGALLRFKGIGLAHFTIRLRLVTSEDWVEWSIFKPLVDKPPLGRRPRSLDVWHPLLVDQGIYAFVVEDLGQPSQTEDGIWTIEIKCIEWRMPKYSLSEPQGAQATPVDPYEVKIGELLGTVKQLDELAK